MENLLKRWMRALGILWMVVMPWGMQGEASLLYVDPGVRQLLALPEVTAAEWVDLSLNRDKEELGIVSVRALGLAADRVLLEVRFDDKPHFALSDLQLAVDLDGKRSTGERIMGRDGVEAHMRVVNHTVGSRLLGIPANLETGEIRALQDDDRVYLLIQTPWLETLPNPSKIRVYGRYKKPHVDADLVIFVSSVESLSRQSEQGGTIPPQESAMIMPSTAFRFWKDQGLHPTDTRSFTGRMVGLAYEKRADKGLTRKMVEPVHSGHFGREKPLPEFRGQYAKGDETRLDATGSVRVYVQEEYGVNRVQAPLSFGAPFKQGDLVSNVTLRLLTEDQTELPASFPVTALWPDGSIKWVLVETYLDISAGDNKELTLVWGEGSSSKLEPWWSETAAGIVVDTGALQARLPLDGFRFLEDVVVQDNIQAGNWKFPHGLVVVSEEGDVFSSGAGKPDRVTLEIATEQRLVVRYEGGYYNKNSERFQKYIARVGFRRGSAKVDLTVTHINDWLEYEFVDFQSLTLEAVAKNAVDAMEFVVDEGEIITGSSNFAYIQKDDRTALLETPQGNLRSGRVPGSFVIKGGIGTWGAVVENAWQRWPKGVQVNGNEVVLSLLPKHPDNHFWAELPGHLIYSFTDGFYRLKWGMSFTERILFDFSADVSALALAAEGQRPLVAVIPAEYYAQTQAFGDVSASDSELTRLWDQFVEKSFEAHEARREKQEEYGFLNYGDWYGERGRNWGNNEYDTAHAFFSQFVRTGDRRYFRAALAAARHQADVDIVHAYPDPSKVGAMHIHSIGHSGSSSHLPTHGRWSFAMNAGVQAGNGHTWAEGMAEAWFLKGDAPVMESVIGLGEHIAWFMAPNFEMSILTRYAGWGLRAICAIYRATGDPVHLQAAEMLALEARNKQHPSGGWFRTDYLTERSDKNSEQQEGLTNFQLGTLIGGYKEYHKLTKDPRVEPTMLAAAEFMRRTWENTGGWPYWITPEAKAHPGRPEFLYGMYCYLAEGVVYVGRTLGNDQESYSRIAREALIEQVKHHEIIASGQRIGNTLRGGNSLLAEMDALEANENN